MVYKLKFQEEAKEQFIALAKMAKGAAASNLIKDAINSESLFQFSELANSVNLIALKEDDKHSQSYKILEFFMNNTLLEYRDEYLPTLNDSELKKLRQLTLLTLAGRSKAISYTELLRELDFKDLADLEDFVIHSISLGIIFGKMDQMNKKLLIVRALDRDTTIKDLPDIINCFKEFQRKCIEARATLKLERNRIVVKARTMRDTREIYFDSIWNINDSIPVSKRGSNLVDEMDFEVKDHPFKGISNKRRPNRN